MKKEIKSEEMTRHFEEIYNSYHNPRIQLKRKLKREKEERLKNKKTDLGM